jgi:quercetin dioxygenase-like cupin family protein
MNKQLPVANALPGAAVPCYMASGEGARYEINGQLVNVIARAADTGGIFSAAYISGGMGAESPFVTHAIEHKTFYVFDGILHVWLPGESRILTPGDSVVIPPGTPHAYRMASHYTRFLNWMTPGGAEAYYERVGTPIDSHVPPVHAGHKRSAREQAEVGAEFGISFPDVERVRPSLQQDAGLPASLSPYFLSAGEGERLVSYQTMFTYLSRPQNTGENYFAVHTKGAKSPYIPLHFHSEHTEKGLLETVPEVMRHNAGIRGVIQLDATLRAEAVSPDHPAHAFILRRDQEIIASLRSEFEREIGAGRVAPHLDPAVLARQTASLIEGVQLAWLYDDSVDMAASLEHFMQLLSTPA